jgi:hypothetical protein
MNFFLHSVVLHYITNLKKELAMIDKQRQDQ